jgi:hypothetical protein
MQHHSTVVAQTETAAPEPNVERDARRRREASGVILILILGACALAPACGSDTIWQEDVPSPDGSWVASASTIQSGGFGTASVDAVVSLKTKKYGNPPKVILSFICYGPVGRPYVLDNKANAGGTIGLSMKWITPTHLEVTYNGRLADLHFQVVKYAGVEISVRDVSTESAKGSK